MLRAAKTFAMDEGRPIWQMSLFAMASATSRSSRIKRKGAFYSSTALPTYGLLNDRHYLKIIG